MPELSSVPFFKQQTLDTCAPACLRIALAYRFPAKSFSEADLARKCGCLRGLGCRVTDVFKAARRCGLKPHWLNDDMIEEEIEEAIEKGHLVMANVQIRAISYYRFLPGWPRAWHSVIILGLVEDEVCAHDPDPLGGANRILQRNEFFTGWKDYGYSAYRL